MSCSLDTGNSVSLNTCPGSHETELVCVRCGKHTHTLLAGHCRACACEMCSDEKNKCFRDDHGELLCVQANIDFCAGDKFYADDTCAATKNER